MNLTAKQKGTVAILLTGTLLAVLNQTLLTPALPSVMADLDIPATTAQWLTSGYSLLEAVIIPLNAYFVGRFSTRQLYVGGMALFCGGSTVCAVAPGFVALMAGRLMQALATGIVMPTVFTLIYLIFPRESRGSAMGLIGLVLAFAPAVGPSVSGLLVDSVGWRALFVLVSALALCVIAFAALRLENMGDFAEASFDVLSVALLAAGMVSMLYGLSTCTSAESPWPYVALIVAGIVILALFGQRQLRLDRPVLGVRVLGVRDYRIAAILVTLLEATLIGSDVILPLYVQNALGESATLSGVLMLPGAFVGALCGMGAGRLFDRWGIRRACAPAAVVLLVGVAGYVTLGPTSSPLLVGILYTVACVGLQCLVTPVNAWGINSLASEADVASGNAIVSTAEQVGGSMGTAFSVSLTALAPLVADAGATEAALSYAGCHLAFMGLAGIAATILGLIVIAVRER